MAVWISSVLSLISAVQVWIGQASFLLLIAAFLSPSAISWQYQSVRSSFLCSSPLPVLWMFLANLARTNLDTSVPIQTALFSNGQYVQAAPSATYSSEQPSCSTFVFIRDRVPIFSPPSARAFFLTRTTYYVLGRAVFISLVFHSIISILASIILFPETLSNNFTKRVAAIFAPLQKANSIHLTLLRKTPGGDFVEESQAALGRLAQAARLLPSEVVYSPYSPRDRRLLQDLLARRVAVRANGMLIDFTLIDLLANVFPSHLQRRDPEPPHHHHLSNLLHRAHLHNSSRFHHRASSSYGNRHTSHAPVSVSESQTFLDLEAHVLPPRFSSSVNPPPYVFNHGLLMLLLETENSSIPLSAWKPDLNVAISVFGRQSFIVLQVSLYSWNGSRVSGRTTINVGRNASAGAAGEEGEEEDPDRVQHVNCDRGSDIEFDELSGETRVGNRVLNDEDDNMFGEFMDRWIYNRVVGLTTGNALYVMKAGVLTTLMCIPFFIPGSAQFAYGEQVLSLLIALNIN
ncbi:hypothetical protein GG344DRAFT_80639 [Lentinula edodes]|nr:hypothetical protein GG344DRAFT_80639 [Lentinula edodes]